MPEIKRGPSKRKELSLPLGVRQDKSGNYFLDYYLNGKRIREWIGKNKKVAVTVMGKRRTEIAEGKFLDKQKIQKVTFSQYAEEYSKTYSVRKKSEARDKTSLNVGDSIRISLPEKKVVSQIIMKKGNIAYVIGGTHIGEIAAVEEITPGTARRPELVELKKGEMSFKTLGKYVFMVGEKEPAISI